MSKSTTPRPGPTRSTQYIIGAAALVVVVAGLIIVSRPQAPSSQALPAPTPVAASAAPSESGGVVGRLSTMQTKFNFRAVSMAQGKVTHRFPIRNTGTEIIYIRKMYTSCMCTTVALVKDGKTSDAYGMPGHTPIPTVNIPIGPRDEAFVEVTFDPAAHGPAGVGPIERVVTVENSAGEPLELGFSALVSP